MEFPQALLVLHPVRQVWQLYEVDGSSDWDALRVRQAILSGGLWWLDRGAPRLDVEVLPAWPGEWLLAFLREADLWRVGGTRGFLREYDDRIERRGSDAAAARHREHRGLADDIRRQARDAFPTGASATDALKEMRRREHRPEIAG